MKRFGIFLAFSVWCTLSYAQTINLRWGGLNDNSGESSSIFYLGQNKNDSSQMICINSIGQVNLFDSSLNRMQHKELMKSLKGDEVVAVCQDAKKWHVFSLDKDGELFESVFDNDEIGIKSNQMLYKFTTAGRLQLASSPDSSKLVFYRLGMVNKKLNLELIVVSSHLKTLYTKQISLSANPETFSNILINNLGEVAWVDNDAKNLIFAQLDSKGKEKTVQTIPIVTKKMHPAVGSVANDKFLFCIGFNRENINYDCLTVLEFVVLTATEISHKATTIPNCIKDAVPMHCITGPNNTAIIVTEEFANTTTASSNTCKYGSLNALCISQETGNLLWQREIFKNLQFVTTRDKKSSSSNPDYITLYSHNLFTFGNKLMFIYNDNCSNCMRAQQTPRTHSDIRKSCLNLVAITETGELIRYSNLAEPQSKYTVHINNTFHVSNKKVIVFGTNTRYMLGRLLLE